MVGLAGTAQAADLAKKAPAAADYVKVCDAYGAGFFYIPGSDTCLRIGGYVRAELRTSDHNANGLVFGGMGYDRNEHAINTLARLHLNFDARTNTEMGLLRSYIELRISNGSAQTGTRPVDVRAAFVQFAGLTAGRAQSNFDFVEGGYQFGIIEADSADHRVNQFAYTFAFGNGITATLAAEDQSTADATSTFGTPGGSNIVKMPDLVANVAIAQAWGRAQLMGALHQNYSADENATAINKLGYAIGAGVEVNLPMLGAGDRVYLQGVYSKGALGYALVNTLSRYDAAKKADVLANVDFDAGTDKLATAWSINGGINHNFSKAVEANLGGSYASYKRPDGTNLAESYKTLVVGGDLRWKPVTGLTVGVGLDYINVDYAATGVASGSSWLGTLRVQRNF